MNELLNIGQHNFIELLKNQMTIFHLASNAKKVAPGLMHVIRAQTVTMYEVARKAGINVEQIEGELNEEINIGDLEKARDTYFNNMSKRTGISRKEFIEKWNMKP